MVNYGGNGVIPQDPQRTMRYIQSESEFTDEAKDYSILLQNEAKKKKNNLRSNVLHVRLESCGKYM
jgi:hypothetical protein